MNPTNGPTKPGAVVVENASRLFRVHPERTITLKEMIVRRRHVRATEVWALRDVSLEISPGEAVALIGRNGSGKTTLLRLIAGIFKPTSGRVIVGGSVGALLEVGAGFHPEFTGRDNIYLNGSLHGLKRKYIQRQLDEIVAFAELEEFLDLPVRTYSAGMYMRLGFSVAMHLDPDVLLLDEILAVGDVAFQRKCFAKIFEYKRRGGTIVFVSHASETVERLCERAILLHEGRVKYDGSAHDAIAHYHRALALDVAPAEREAGLREWGTGQVRIVRVRLEGQEGEQRVQFLSGEPLVLKLWISPEQAVSAPRVTVELREATGSLLGEATQDLDLLGWDRSNGEHLVGFHLDSLPLAEGRFNLSIALSDGDGVVLYHRLEDAADFIVYPEHGQARGAVRVEGTWSLTPSSGVPAT
jgi:ABC-type polysaccharide/polyol phosphate transport system ATPase subunit